MSTPVYSKAVMDALARFEEECFGREMIDKTVEWIISLYDAETAGFYYKTCAKYTKGFLPEVELTAKALGILKNFGVIDTSRLGEIYTPEMKERLKHFAQRHQSPEDGFWYELPWGKNINDSKRLYESGAAKQLLKMIGEAPLYPTAEERVKNKEAQPAASGAPLTGKALLAAKKFDSREDFKEWFDGYLDWERSIYSAGSHMLSHGSLIKSAGYMDYAMELMTAKINPETGYLDHNPTSPDRDYDHMSGTYKISNFYFESKKYEMPYFDKVMESTEHTIITDYPGVNGCHIANPWALLRNAIQSQKDPDKKVLEQYYDILPTLLDRTREKILSLRGMDGIYTFTPGVGIGGNQGMLAAMPLWEGDLNGNAMIISATRNHIYNALQITPPKLTSTWTAEKLIEKVSVAAPTKKIEPAVRCAYDFTKMPAGDLPTDGFRFTGDVSIAEDPVCPGKNALRLTSLGGIESLSKGGRPVLLIDAGTEKGKGFTCEYGVRFDASSRSNLFFLNEFGTFEYSTVLSFKRGDDGYTMGRTADKAKDVYTAADWAEKYHRVKIVYMPNGKDTKTEIYVDGVLVDTSGYFVGNYPKKPAPENVFCVMFCTNHDNPYTAYISDFRFEENE